MDKNSIKLNHLNVKQKNILTFLMTQQIECQVSLLKRMASLIYEAVKLTIG